jgi:putative flippase GtrA
MENMLDYQLLRFLFAGGIAAAANFGSRFIFSLWFNFEAAIILAYLVGMLVAFLLMRGYVFNACGKSIVPQITKFIIVNLMAVSQTLAISVALARWGLPVIGINTDKDALAHLVGVLVPVGTSYVGHRMATFR